MRAQSTNLPPARQPRLVKPHRRAPHHADRHVPPHGHDYPSPPAALDALYAEADIADPMDCWIDPTAMDRLMAAMERRAS